MGGIAHADWVERRMLNNMKIGTRLSLIVVTAIVGMIAVMVAGLLMLRGELLEDRRLLTRHIIESAQGLAGRFHAMAESGEITMDEARTLTMEAIRGIRYGDGEYIFILDTRGTMIMHPANPALEGRDMTGLEDRSGNRFINDMLRLANGPEGNGYVYYWWPKPGQEAAVEKVSFVDTYKPFGLVMGTGVYLDDVASIFWQRTLILGLIEIGRAHV